MTNFMTASLASHSTVDAANKHEPRLARDHAFLAALALTFRTAAMNAFSRRCPRAEHSPCVAPSSIWCLERWRRRSSATLVAGLGPSRMPQTSRAPHGLSSRRALNSLVSRWHAGDRPFANRNQVSPARPRLPPRLWQQRRYTRVWADRPGRIRPRIFRPGGIR